MSNRSKRKRGDADDNAPSIPTGLPRMHPNIRTYPEFDEMMRRQALKSPSLDSDSWLETSEAVDLSEGTDSHADTLTNSKSNDTQSSPDIIHRIKGKPAIEAVKDDLLVDDEMTEDDAAFLIDVHLDLAKENRNIPQDDANWLQEELEKEANWTLTQPKKRSALDQMDWERLKRCAKFFDIPVVDLCRRDFMSGLNNLFKMALRSHQLYAIFCCLESEIESSLSSFICDGPGVGKTYVSYAIMVISRMLTENQIEVLESRKQEDDNHLQHSVAGRCPSRADRHFQCACEQGSLASRHIPKLGVNILIAPATLVPQLLSDFDNLVAAEQNFLLYTDLPERRQRNLLWNTDIMRQWAPHPSSGHKLDAERVVIVMSDTSFPSKFIDLLKKFPVPGKDKEEEEEKEKEEEEGNDDDEDLLPAFFNEKARQYALQLKASQGFHIGRLMADECHKYNGAKHRILAWLLNRTTDPISIYP